MRRKIFHYLRLFICSLLMILFIGNFHGYTVAQTQPLQKPREVTAIAFSPDGNTVATGVSDSQIALLDTKTGNLMKNLPGHLGAPVSGAVFSPDGKILRTVGKDTVVRFWNLATGEESEILEGPEHPPRTLAMSPDGKTLFTSGEDPKIFQWNVNTNQLTKVLEGHRNFVNTLAVSPDGKTLVSGDAGGAVIFWNLITGQKLQTLASHAGAVTGLAFSPDGTNLASASQDRTVRLWNVANAKEIQVFRDATKPLKTVAFSRNGQSLVAGGDENTIFVWNAKSGGLRLRLSTVDAVTGVSISPDGTSFASGSRNGDVDWWNLNSGVRERTVKLNNLLPIRPKQVPTPSNRNKVLKTSQKPLKSTTEGRIQTSKATLMAAIPSPPGGPILVVTSAANPFSNYYAEILRTEGLNLFNVTDISSVSSSTLANYDVVILSEMPLTSAQATMFTNWVTSGGNLIAMRPDKQLAGLLGLTDAASTLANAYLLVNNSTSAGKGIVNQTIQFHGTADRYTLNGAESIATFYSNATTSTSNPAVTLRSVGSNGGQAAAFTYDLARSIVYTRQGNPAWAEQERDGFSPIRSDDLFFGNKSGDPQPDWVDLNKVAIPQADEQQRLLANLILQMNLPKKPLPRFWYFPHGKKAVVLMSGDDHANGGTASRFDKFKLLSPAGCSVDDWQCIRGTSYIYPNSPLTNPQANQYVNIDGGFEVALHINTNCADYTASSLNATYTQQLSSFTSKYTNIESPKTQRHHCLVWSDWFSTPQIELNNGIRLDTTYYYWPPTWITDRPGFFTGSGMPMRFVNQDGAMIDVFGAPTQLTDESGQSYPYNIDTLLDRAIGTEGYYGVFNVNAHTDFANSSVSDAVVDSALARGIPIVSAKQVLTWLDGRNSSSFSSLAWNNNNLSFTITKGSNSNGLQAMLPTSSGNLTLSNITLNGGTPVSYTTAVVKGVEYAFFPGNSGNYVATYTSDNIAPTVSSTTPSSNATNVSTTTNITAAFSESIDSTTIDGTNFELRNSSNTLIPATVTYNATNRTATLTPSNALATATTYTATIKGGSTGVKDLTGNALATSYSWSFATSANQTPQSIWNNSATPTNPSFSDSNAVELGVKFRSNVDGYITGVRFYKGAGNTGTHTGTLWSSTGQQLATATFTNETTSGWQTVNFTNPVLISANTVYVASYYAPAGNYAVDLGYFANSGISNGPLYLLRDGESGSNGIYKYGGGFPDSSFQSANYWVDILFIPSIATDTTPPTVSSTTPSNNATGVSNSTTITATFSEDIDSSTINTTNFELRNSSNTLVPVTVTYSATNRTATLVPSSNLAISTTYTARIKGGASGIKDLAGNALTVDYTWSFTTLGDTTSPTVSSTTPSNNATGVSTSPSITAIFSEAIDSTTINTTNFELRNSTNTLVPATVTYNSSNLTATLTPSAALANSTAYTVRIKGGTTGVKDLAGNVLAADYTWSFTTVGDTTPPTVSSTTPSNNATGVSTSPSITAIFSEAINSTTINTTNFELRNSANTLIPATVTYNATNRTATLVPSTALVNSTTYTVRIKGGTTGVKDIAGNTLAADYTWSFTTVADTTAPTVTSSTPSNNAFGVSIFTSITVTFSEPINSTTINSTNFELRNSLNIPVLATVTYNQTNRTATLKPILPLLSLSTYTATVKGGTTGVKDLAGNALASNYTWKFTTGLL
ncbi:Ig-like domain-containing protein [Nostoc linckia FACHB-104]|nr:Ig-like domain-containing protein [Nostoc linckia FACHB-104]